MGSISHTGRMIEIRKIEIRKIEIHNISLLAGALIFRITKVDNYSS